MSRLSIVPCSLLLSLVACGLPARPEAPVKVDLAALELRGLDALAARPAGPEADDSVAIRTWADRLGQAHVRAQQRIGGVPVFGHQALVHFDAQGAWLSTTDARFAGAAPDLNPDLSADQALQIAQRAEGVSATATPIQAADLWILPRPDGAALAWRVSLRDLDAATPSLPVIFVDAHSGQALWRYDNLQTDSGSGVGHYTDGLVSFEVDAEDGEDFVMLDGARALWTRDAAESWRAFDEADELTSATGEYWNLAPSAVDVHWGVRQTWDWYHDRFAWDGVDGQGGPTLATVRVGSGYVNAYWDGTGIFFGEGDGVTSDPLTALDIVGHELAHAVTEHSAGLIYSGESGGLNEATSDILAAALEYAVRGRLDEGTFLVGEDCWTPRTSGDALRYMANPGRDGSSKDFYTPAAGHVDVHYSSGIANLAFTLAATGGAHPRMGGEPVDGVGVDAAAEVWFRALTTYMTPSTDFAAAREATLAAAEDLYGPDSHAVEAFANAWATVGVGARVGSLCEGQWFDGVAAPGARVLVPDEGFLPVRSGAMVSATLTGGADAALDLRLEARAPSGLWLAVDRSAGPGAQEEVSAAVASTSARLVIEATQAGNYSLCLQDRGGARGDLSRP